jgi:2-polyprenyl-3-methyl-5-hydroxy-6-metoxy-1,4-benzoquinol methylase
MVFQLIKLNIDVSDESFNEIYPESIRKFCGRHWTPVAVAKMAAAYLADQPGARILDIGSGAGKFCMVGVFVRRRLVYIT